MKFNIKRAKTAFPSAISLPHVTTCHLQAGVVGARNYFIILVSLVSVTMLRLRCVTDGHTSQIMVMTLGLLEIKVQLLDELQACNWIPHTAPSACLTSYDTEFSLIERMRCDVYAMLKLSQAM